MSEDNPLCGALLGKQNLLNEKWHAPVLEGLVTIPKVERGAHFYKTMFG